MKYNYQNHINPPESPDFSQAKFAPEVQKIQSQTKDIISNIIDERRLVLYKNSSGKMFYVFFSKQSSTGTYLISRITPVKGSILVGNTLTKKEQNQILEDAQNGTNISGMIPVQNTEYKSALNRVVESFHREKEVKAFSGTFGYTNTKGNIIQVEVEAGKILSARSEGQEVSTQQKAAIQKMILMNRFGKFVNIKLQAANDEVYFDEEVSGEAQENIAAVQAETMQNVEEILEYTPEMYKKAKGKKETFSSKSEKIETQESLKKEPESEKKQDLNLELIAHYNKIKKVQKYLQIIEINYFNRNIMSASKQKFSKEQIFAVVHFLESISGEFNVIFDKKIFLDQKLTNKFFKKIFGIFHTDREQHPQAKIVKKEIMQALQHVKDHIIIPENLQIIFPQKTASGYKSTQKNSGSFSVRA